LLVSTKTRACLALSRRDCFASLESGDAGEEVVDIDVADESAEVKEKPELELDERELEREWAEMVESGDDDRTGPGN
jgi:hypothetical protein